MTTMDPQSERELLEQLKAGNAAAFDAVYALYNARLFTFLVRLARNRDRAADLLEETWLRLVTHADRLHPDTRLGPWLFTVSRNLYVSACRARVFEASDAALLQRAALGPSPFEEAAASESEARIEAALAGLPLHYREVLLLVGVEGLGLAEAAAVCGISNVALRQRLSRARAMLAHRLEAGGLPNLRVREVNP
jgi:RNA polymerase sigma-70 factor (ECF subfamily)